MLVFVCHAQFSFSMTLAVTSNSRSIVTEHSFIYLYLPVDAFPAHFGIGGVLVEGPGE